MTGGLKLSMIIEIIKDRGHNEIRLTGFKTNISVEAINIER